MCRADSRGYLDFGRTDRGLSAADRKRRVTEGQEEASSMLLVVLVYSILLILFVVIILTCHGTLSRLWRIDEAKAR